MADNTKTEMNEQIFWSLIERAKPKIKPKEYSIDDEKAQLSALRKVLAPLSKQHLLEFDAIYQSFIDKAYHQDLWAAAFIINGGCSDDGFQYFRDWLISQGETDYKNALKDPEFLIGVADPGGSAFELFRYVVIELYEEKFQEKFPYGKQDDVKLQGDDWDEETVDQKYPELAEWISQFD